MSLIQKKDVGLLLHAGFTMEDLGLSDGAMQGVEIYETPSDYFAKELIDNACEEGTIDLMDEPTLVDEDWIKPRYDTSRKGLYEDNVYDGAEDFFADVPAHLRAQAEFLRDIKIGRMTIWQRRNKKNMPEWQVRSLKVEIPVDDKPRFNRLSKEYQKELWINYMKDEWKKVWEFTIDSMKSYPIEDKIQIKTRHGYPLNLLVISADNVRQEGYRGLPPEARWITMAYFDKDKR